MPNPSDCGGSYCLELKSQRRPYFLLPIVENFASISGEDYIPNPDSSKRCIECEKFQFRIQRLRREMDGDDEVYKDTETLLEEGLFRVMKDDNRFVFGPFVVLSSSPNGVWGVRFGTEETFAKFVVLGLNPPVALSL